MERWQIIKGTVVILSLVLIPGFALSLALYPRKDELDFSERLALSFLLGLVPELILYILDKNFAIATTMKSVWMVVMVCTLAGVVIWRIRLQRA